MNAEFTTVTVLLIAALSTAPPTDPAVLLLKVQPVIVNEYPSPALYCIAPPLLTA